jgi:hypothetical protein
MPTPKGRPPEGNPRPDPTPNKRPWAVTLLGLLLLVQAAGLFGLGALNLTRFNWEKGLSSQNISLLFTYGLNGAAYSALGFLALWAAVSFFRVWANGWLSAVLLQGLCLSMALAMYFREKSFNAYPVMLYCIVMVLYLNYSEVLAAFRTRGAKREWY